MVRPAAIAVSLASLITLATAAAVFADTAPSPPGQVNVQPVTISAGSSSQPNSNTSVSTGQAGATSNGTGSSAAHCGVAANAAGSGTGAQPAQVSTSWAS